MSPLPVPFGCVSLARTTRMVLVLFACRRAIGSGVADYQ